MVEIQPDGTTRITTERTRGGDWRKLRLRVIREESLCYLCGLEVDKELDYPDPMSASVDHLVPVALGGLEVDRTNVALTHLDCNKRRGIKAIDEVRYTPNSQVW